MRFEADPLYGKACESWQLQIGMAGARMSRHRAPWMRPGSARPPPALHSGAAADRRGGTACRIKPALWAAWRPGGRHRRGLRRAAPSACASTGSAPMPRRHRAGCGHPYNACAPGSPGLRLPNGRRGAGLHPPTLLRARVADAVPPRNLPALEAEGGAAPPLVRERVFRASPSRCWRSSHWGGREPPLPPNPPHLLPDDRAASPSKLRGGAPPATIAIGAPIACSQCRWRAGIPGSPGPRSLPAAEFLGAGIAFSRPQTPGANLRFAWLAGLPRAAFAASARGRDSAVGIPHRRQRSAPARRNGPRCRRERAQDSGPVPKAHWPLWGGLEGTPLNTTPLALGPGADRVTPAVPRRPRSPPSSPAHGTPRSAARPQARA